MSMLVQTRRIGSHATRPLVYQKCYEPTLELKISEPL